MSPHFISWASSNDILTSDNVISYAGSSENIGIETVLNFWINFNNTTTTPIVNTINDNGTSIEHSQYTDGDGSVSVEHYKVINGGHVWFDMNYQGVNINELIWNFVSKYDVNGLR